MVDYEITIRVRVGVRGKRRRRAKKKALEAVLKRPEIKEAEVVGSHKVPTAKDKRRRRRAAEKAAKTRAKKRERKKEKERIRKYGRGKYPFDDSGEWPLDREEAMEWLRTFDAQLQKDGFADRPIIFCDRVTGPDVVLVWNKNLTRSSGRCHAHGRIELSPKSDDGIELRMGPSGQHSARLSTARKDVPASRQQCLYYLAHEAAHLAAYRIGGREAWTENAPLFRDLLDLFQWLVKKEIGE